MTTTDDRAEGAPSAFELLPPEVIEDPYPFYDMLRESAPVFHVEEHDIWVVTRHDLCLEALKRPDDFLQWTGAEMFTPGQGPALGPPELWAPQVRDVMSEGYETVNTLVTANAPEHTEYRSIVLNAFSAGRTAIRMKDRIYQITDALIDAFASDGEVELIRQFAVPLPLTVIAEILGVPSEDFETFKRWSDDAVVAIGGGVDTPRMVESAASIVEFQRYFEKIINDRRHNPTDDVISVMAAAKTSSGRPLDIPEMLSILLQMLVAGNETTTSLIGSAMWRILDDVSLRDELVAHSDRIPAAIEEALRIEAPVQGLFRRTEQEQPLGEHRLPAGAKVLIMYGAANRDGCVYEKPAEFQPQRQMSSGHLAFGYGAHFCVGAALARKEAVIALERLLTRLPNVRLKPGSEVKHQMHPLLRGLDALWVDFDA